MAFDESNTQIRTGRKTTTTSWLSQFLFLADMQILHIGFIMLIVLLEFQLATHPLPYDVDDERLHFTLFPKLAIFGEEFPYDQAKSNLQYEPIVILEYIVVKCLKVNGKTILLCGNVYNFFSKNKIFIIATSLWKKDIFFYNCSWSILKIGKKIS